MTIYTPTKKVHHHKRPRDVVWSQSNNVYYPPRAQTRAADDDERELFRMHIVVKRRWVSQPTARRCYPHFYTLEITCSRS